MRLWDYRILFLFFFCFTECRASRKGQKGRSSKCVTTTCLLGETVKKKVDAYVYICICMYMCMYVYVYVCAFWIIFTLLCNLNYMTEYQVRLSLLMLTVLIKCQIKYLDYRFYKSINVNKYLIQMDGWILFIYILHFHYPFSIIIYIPDHFHSETILQADDPQW